MLNLQRTAMFIAVADTGSFTAAAEAMGLTKAVVSFHIRQLEEELGVTLLLRTTRRLTLTEAGKLFHQRSVMLLRDAERLQDDVRANHAGLTGELRVTTTPEYGSQVVVPLLAEFSQLHPDLRVRHVSSSLHADLIAERFDVAIRLGTLADSRYHAALMTFFTILPVATPGWLANHPVNSLEQLAEADWIIHERLTSPLRWQVRGVDGQPVSFEIKKAPRLYADSAQALMALPSRDVEWRCCRSGWCETHWMQGNWSRCYRRTRSLSRASMPFILMPGMCPRKCEHLLILCASGLLNPASSF